MPSLLQRFTGRTLARRVLVSMLLLSLVPNLIAAGLNYWAAEAALELSVHGTLHRILNAKKNALERYVHERVNNVDALRRAPGVIDAFTQLKAALAEAGGRDSDGYKKAADLFRPLFNSYARIYGFKNYLLCGPDGQVVYLEKPWAAAEDGLLQGPLATSELANTIREIKADVAKYVPVESSAHAEVSDYRKLPGLPTPAAFVVGPVLKGDELLCFVVTQIDDAALEEVLRDPTGLGETGETLAATEIDGKVVVIAATRDPKAAFETIAAPGSALAAAVGGSSDKGPLAPTDEDDENGSRNSVNAAKHRTEYDYKGEWVVQSWAYVPSLGWGMVVKKDVDEAYALLDTIFLAVAVLLTVVTVVILFAALWLSESIASPIRDAANAASRVAGGDLTLDVKARGDEESRQLLRAVQGMTEQLRSLIGRIQESSLALLSTATEIAATARQQERTVQDFGASTAESVAAVREISATNHELVQTMNDVAAVAEHTATTAAQGRDQLGTMEGAVERLAAETSAVSGRLSVISERANTISMVVTTITKVADQTNLLSINAAIEAEKAGEAGLGFLVVAREIRRLADQTAVATLDIERVVKDMQGSVAAGVMEMDKFTEQVRQGVFEIRGLSGQLGNIIQEVQGVSAQFGRVNEGMRAQAVGAEQIREAMARLSEGAQQTAQSIVEFNRATSHMREAVGSLKEEVSRFTIKDAGERGHR